MRQGGYAADRRRGRPLTKQLVKKILHQTALVLHTLCVGFSLILGFKIQELKLYCDEAGKIWGGAVSSPNGAAITFPAALLTFAPITFAPVEPQIEEGNLVFAGYAVDVGRNQELARFKCILFPFHGIPPALLTFAPITFAPVEPQIEEE